LHELGYCLEILRLVHVEADFRERADKRSTCAVEQRTNSPLNFRNGKFLHQESQDKAKSEHSAELYRALPGSED